MTPELGMQSTAIKENPEECQRKIHQKNFAWVDNPDVFSSGSGTTPNTQEDGSDKSDPYIKSGFPDQVGE